MHGPMISSKQSQPLPPSEPVGHTKFDMSASSAAVVLRGAAARGSQLEAAALARVVQPRPLHVKHTVVG